MFTLSSVLLPDKELRRSPTQKKKPPAINQQSYILLLMVFFFCWKCIGQRLERVLHDPLPFCQTQLLGFVSKRTLSLKASSSGAISIFCKKNMIQPSLFAKKVLKYCIFEKCAARHPLGKQLCRKEPGDSPMSLTSNIL